MTSQQTQLEACLKTHFLIIFCLSFSCRKGLLRCFEPSSLPSWERVLILNYVAFALGFLLPFLTIMVCYSRLIQRLRARPDFGGSTESADVCRKKKHRSVHLVTMVTVTFLLFFFPYHVARSLHLHAVRDRWSCGVTLALQRAVVVTLCLATSNSVVNPLLYYYSTRMFRDNIRDAHSALGSIRALIRNTSEGNGSNIPRIHA